MKRICCLGAGAWGFCLASMLVKKGYHVTVWGHNKEKIVHLRNGGRHPSFPDALPDERLHFTSSLEEALLGADLIVESVSSSGIRPVFSEIVKKNILPNCPIAITSKGIEQNSGLLFTELLIEILGEEHMYQIGCLSGPSLAGQIMRGQPASVVCSAYGRHTLEVIQDIFHSPLFRVYPNSDIKGVCFGGAMKNIIAIACGISDGLGFGDNSKSALMTRGLHEIKKLSVVKECNPETLNGLAGVGDLCTTCFSPQSRNYRYGNLIAQGLSPEAAKKEIGMVVEGAYTCLSALQLAREAHIPIPITTATHSIIYEGMDPSDAVKSLMARQIKEEHL